VHQLNLFFAVLLAIATIAPAAYAAQPSYDCNRASRPDEFAICNDDALAALDRTASAGYLYLRSKFGPPQANAINRPFIQSRQACGANVSCIERTQIDAIKTFIAYGAPINAATATTPTRTYGSAQGQTRVRLELDGGTFMIPMYINEHLRIKGILDTGASDISIPLDVMQTLIRTETIKKEDLVGVRNYQLADGSINKGVVFSLRSVRVADKMIFNVTASVTSEKGPILLGQSFLRRFSSWSIDNKSQTLVLTD